MKLRLLSPSRTALTILCGMVLAAGIVTTPARADLFDKKTILTVNQPIQVTDTVLEPGQYVLKLLDSQADRHIVQIFNRDQTHIINTVLAIPAERLEPTGKTEFTFWETPPGSYRALRRWYYPGDNFGQEFAYPRHLQQVAMVTPPASTPAPAAEPFASSPAPTTAETTTPSEATTPEPAPEPQPAEVAQNANPAPAPDANPAPAPAEPQTQSAPEKPNELPKTGSPYPGIGIAGILLIGGAGLLRLKRQA